MTDRPRADIHYDFLPSQRDRRSADDQNEGLVKWKIRQLAEVGTVVATILAILSFFGATPTREPAMLRTYRNCTLVLVVRVVRIERLVVDTATGRKSVRTLRQSRWLVESNCTGSQLP
jgi:hypothetical protein